jgi:phenylacetate-CoA ligase
MSGRVCSCGRSLPLIDEVRGRQNDMVVDPGGQAVHSEFFTHLLREEARVQSFQVVFDDTRLVVNLHTEALNPADQEALSTPYRARIASSLAFDRIDFVFNQPFLTLANGKHRFVMRKPVW